MSSVNVSYKYLAAKERYDKAVTQADKMAALQEMAATAPSHKGGENLRKDISRKIAELKRQMEKQKVMDKKRGSGKTMHVKKEGPGQVALVGLPNVGKSLILERLTKADVEIANYPFTTKKPEVGMINYKNAKIQLVELPAIIEGASEGKASGTQLFSIIRSADALVFVLDVLNDPIKQIETLFDEFEKANVKVNKERPQVTYRSAKFGGTNIACEELFDGDIAHLKQYLKTINMSNIDLIIKQKVNLEELAAALNKGIVFKKLLVVLNKVEHLDDSYIEEIDSELKKRFSVETFVFRDKQNEIDSLCEEIFKLLDVIIIYTKKQGGEADMSEPMVVNRGSTIEEVAKQIHKDFARKLRYAKVWGSTKFDGQRVQKDYEVKDGDIVEFTI